MRRIRDFFEYGSILPTTVIAAAVVGFFAIFGLVAVPELATPVADMRIEPLSRIVTPEETFRVNVVVESSVPVNVFSGELLFDNEVLQVDSIDYNTSIADLWAEEPWFENGEGTLSFIGGTTKEGGFRGNADLMTITFRAEREGEGSLIIKDAVILRHDGLGTNAPIEEPIDALFTVEKEALIESETVLRKDDVESEYLVVETIVSTDLNGDGKQSIRDISIFMLNMAGNDPLYDFNTDGTVDTKDLSILLDAM